MNNLKFNITKKTYEIDNPYEITHYNDKMRDFEDHAQHYFGKGNQNPDTRYVKNNAKANESYKGLLEDGSYDSFLHKRFGGEPKNDDNNQPHEKDIHAMTLEEIIQRNNALLGRNKPSKSGGSTGINFSTSTEAKPDNDNLQQQDSNNLNSQATPNFPRESSINIPQQVNEGQEYHLDQAPFSDRNGTMNVNELEGSSMKQSQIDKNFNDMNKQIPLDSPTQEMQNQTFQNSLHENANNVFNQNQALYNFNDPYGYQNGQGIQMEKSTENHYPTMEEIIQGRATNVQPETNPFSDLKVSNPYKKTDFYANPEDKGKSDETLKKYMEPFSILSREKIKYLPYEEQIRLLFMENEKLNSQLIQYKKLYGELEVDESGLSTQTKFKNLIMKENQDLIKQNKIYENIIKQLLTFINLINKKLNRDTIDFTDLNKDRDAIEYYLRPLKYEIFNHIKRSLKRQKKGDGNEISTSPNSPADLSENEINYRKSRFMQNVINRNTEDNGHQYNYYSPDKIKSCLACDMGLGNSQKGYSPLMCSPNRMKYIAMPDNSDDEV